jgi:hypothetical protein
VKRALLAVLATFLVAIAIVPLRPVIWMRDFQATVDCNGQRLAGSQVYRGKDGALFVILAPPYYRAYVIETQEPGAVGIPAYDFVIKTGIVQIARQSPFPFVNLRSPKVDNRDPKLQVNGRTAEFLDYDHHAVRVTW